MIKGLFIGIRGAISIKRRISFLFDNNISIYILVCKKIRNKTRWYIICSESRMERFRCFKSYWGAIFLQKENSKLN
jgi:hypothetical protein